MTTPTEDEATPRLATDLVAAGAPGAVVMVSDGRRVTQAAAGLADITTRRPMQPDLRFRAGSVTKTFVATALLLLEAEGRLRLDDTVDRWLPGSLPYGDQVTIRQLLNHTGGVPNYPDSLWEALYTSPEARYRAWKPHKLVGLVAGEPQLRVAGSAWRYSNVGYILAGLVMEAVSRSTLAAELARLISEPLGLRDTFMPAATDIPGRSARGYTVPLGRDGEPTDGRLVDFTVQDSSYAWAAGGIVSSMPDLIRFFQALLDGTLLPPAQRDQMLAMVPVATEALPLPLYSAYGLGVVQVDSPGGPLIGTAGGIVGFLNMLLSTPDGGRLAGVMINVGDRAPAQVIETFLRALGELGGVLHAGEPATVGR
jgi:D-alanyl-D-alanine carboxypeptidase